MAPIARSTLERFMAKVRIADNGCWLWTAGIDRNGRGRFAVGSTKDGTKRTALAHRAGYELLVGPIPAGMTLDHVCHNRDPDCNLGNACLHRRCVNPEHLDPVPIRTNILRGKGQAPKNAARTHCKRGHPFEGDNLIILRGGRRRCAACALLRQRAFNQTEKRKEYNRLLAQGEQRKAHMAQYRAANRERSREYQREYYIAHRAAEVVPRVPISPEEQAERKRQRGREHYRANRERILAERAARKAEQDPAERRAKQREYAAVYNERNREQINALRRERRRQEREAGGRP